ncbi:MAG: NTP transferase domain-containing protein [Desulfobacterales bacterium]|nr:NTP transferase domain-containing protein [Desulfobacterales bacterium]
MKCLIIAAGKGSRLWPKGKSKPLISILGVPLIERVIRSAMQAEIDDFYVVSGYQGDRVRHFLDRLARRCRIKITHIINHDWELGNGLSVLKAREHLGGPFLLLMGDHLFDPAILRDLASKPLPDGEITLGVDSDTANSLINMDDVTRVRSESGKVRDIGKGLGAFDGFDTGIFLCTPALFEALERSAAKHGDSSLTGGVRSLAAEGKVNVFDIGGRFWLDVDDPKDLARAERALLDQMRDKPNDGPVSRYINRPVSVRISRHLTRLSVTPDQISLVSFLCSLIAAGLFALGGYAALLTGGMLAQFASIIDGCDGEVARLKYCESDFGGWFDAVLDRYADAFLLFGLTWHACGGGADGIVLLIGFLAIIGSFMLSYTADKHDSLMRARIAGSSSLRIGRDIRVFMIFLGALFNQPFWALLIIAAMMNTETVRRVIVCRGHR